MKRKVRRNKTKIRSNKAKIRQKLDEKGENKLRKIIEKKINNREEQGMIVLKGLKIGTYPIDHAISQMVK